MEDGGTIEEDTHDSIELVMLRKGSFLTEYRDEILHLVTNEEKRARERNLRHRIMGLREENGLFEITTIDEKPAQRIGRRLRKTCGGPSRTADRTRTNASRVQREP